MLFAAPDIFKYSREHISVITNLLHDILELPVIGFCHPKLLHQRILPKHMRGRSRFFKSAKTLKAVAVFFVLHAFPTCIRTTGSFFFATLH
jgi:hypothetical protein